MDLKSTQLKDTYGNLLTIGTTAGSPTTGTLENGDGEDITALDVAGTITSDGLTSDGNISLSGNGTGNRNLFLGSETASYAGTFRLQAGGGSAGFGGGLTMYGHSHASKPGDVAVGISNGSGGSFRVNGNGIDTGTDLFEVKSTRDIAFFDGSGSEAFYWDASTARLGIGTTSPTEKLQIVDSANDVHVRIGSGNAGINPTLRFHGKNTADTTNVYADIRVNPDNQTLGFSGTGTSGGSIEQDALVIDSSGNVGIGASTVDDKLHVIGTSTKIQELGQAGITMKFNHGNNASVNSDINIANIKSFVSSGSSGSEGGGLKFETKPTSGSATPVMTLDSNGRLLVGTESALSGFSGTTQRACFSATGDTMTVEVGSGTGAYTGIHIDRTSSDGKAISFERGNTDVGSISVTTVATAYNTSSDYRLKENVVDMTGALDRVDQLKPSRFNFIADADTTVDGFLAHEVADVVPEAISGEKDAVDDEGNPIYQGIDQSKLVPLLVGAIQELRAEIEQLKAK